MSFFAGVCDEDRERILCRIVESADAIITSKLAPGVFRYVFDLPKTSGGYVERSTLQEDLKDSSQETYCTGVGLCVAWIQPTLCWGLRL